MKFSTSAIAATVGLAAMVSAANPSIGHLQLSAGDPLRDGASVEPLIDTASGNYIAYASRDNQAEYSIVDGRLQATLESGEVLYANVGEKVVDGMPFLWFTKDSTQTGYEFDDRGYLRKDGSVNWYACNYETEDNYLRFPIALFKEPAKNGVPPHPHCEYVWPRIVPLFQSTNN
ncbi:hypothetical protein TRVA0_018S01728 [Trichomonascus vanleenenianus]|uniref:uncharacterized protein n=1 Tax=Trichomonascus vanleenenianus TaxID=2268995 RepID=UPI003EC9DB59